MPGGDKPLQATQQTLQRGTRPFEIAVAGFHAGSLFFSPLAGSTYVSIPRRDVLERQVMQQESLFHERIEDAIAAVADGIGRKRLACELWPDKAERDAHNLFDACLNPERRERFSPSQLMFVAKKGRAAGLHAIVQYMARELGYTDPQPIEPEDERAKLQREFIASTRTLARMAERIEQLERPTPSAIRAA